MIRLKESVMVKLYGVLKKTWIICIRDSPTEKGWKRMIIIGKIRVEKPNDSRKDPFSLIFVVLFCFYFYFFSLSLFYNSFLERCCCWIILFSTFVSLNLATVRTPSFSPLTRFLPWTWILLVFRLRLPSVLCLLTYSRGLFFLLLPERSPRV